MNERRTLLFDFDGVIADTFHIAHGVAKKLCVYLTETEYRKRFNGNIYDLRRALLAADHGDRCDHALDWWAEFAPGFKTTARPFDDMPELLKRFAETYTLYIVSSSRDELIAHFLEKYALTDAVKGSYGVDVNTRKDEKFRMLFRAQGVRAEECVFITDTLGDINEAASVGISSIGVTWGFQDNGTLSRGNPFAIVDAPQELPSAVEIFFASR
ncbi:MAG TPA: HAD-IA family hydrolase [Candidatus Paceibacterota bacterium]|jgi:HAD superfamily hydrolase (TIGR01549 family)|nr:HAD-IA family hydrolase [Candidatus Paceibacterota bacterium]